MAANRAVLVGCVRGVQASSDIAVVRLTGAGILDASFSDDGIAVIRGGRIQLDEHGAALGVQTGGRIGSLVPSRTTCS